MSGAITRGIAAVVAIAFLSTATGCANTMSGLSEDASSMGNTIKNNPKAALGTLGGAGGGALIAGLAGAGAPWIVGAALMGGLLGGYVGHKLDQRDKEMATEAAYRAFEKNRSGQKSVWKNPNTGNYGEVVPVKTYQLADGRYCRRYEQTIFIGGEKQTSSGTACRNADGTWAIQS
jgi:surface antigen